MSELILGIETSCDETAAAVVEDGSRVLSNVVARQAEFHRKWGGVVPEIASRKHLEAVNYVVEEALEQAGVGLEEVEAVGVTIGPGLEGALLVGVSAAKGICLALDKPLVAVSHLEGHVCANFLLQPPPALPFVCLVASGGHSEIVVVRLDSPSAGAGRAAAEVAPSISYESLGGTRDDAAGEAFDKIGRVLGFEYPAGAEVDRVAREGNRKAIAFPRTHFADSFDFSFSGIKTAAARYIAKLSQGECERQMADICASFQEAVVEVLVEHTLAAAKARGINVICVGGGVAANSRLRSYFGQRCEEEGIQLFFPPPDFCLDNAAMIAVAAHWKLKRGEVAGLGVDVFPHLGWTS
jgi:N6-L-threonylcarbamoyladenine synthase